MSANDKVRATRHDPSGTLPDRLRAAAPFLGVVDALLMEEAAAALDGRGATVGAGVVLIAPPVRERRHVCREVLPDVCVVKASPTGPVYREVGLLAICSCGRGWVVREDYGSMAPVAWRPVRWWHRRLRERIWETVPPPPAPPGSSYADRYQGETVPVTTRELLDLDDE